MADFIEGLTHRNEDCEALLSDNGRETSVPVCMGGTALAGCNNPEECKPLFGGRMAKEDPTHGYCVFMDEATGRVGYLARVARAKPLVPVRPASLREA